MKPCPAVSWGTIGAVKERAGLEVTASENSTPKAGVDAKQGGAAKAGAGKPYVIYFCNKVQAETAGLGSTAIRARANKKGPRKPFKFTVFESRLVIEGFKKAGFSEYYKVTPSKENLPLVKKYSVRRDNTVVFCAPGGEMVACLGGMECNQTNVLKVLKSWTMLYQAWQKRQASK